MRGMRAASFRIDQHLSVAMIGGHDDGPAALPHCGVYASQACIHSFDRRHSRLDFSRVADHVGVSKIYDDHLKRFVFDGLHHRIGDPRGAHLRCKIISRHLLRRYKHAILAGKGLLNAAVEEVSDVSIFLRLCYAEIAQIRSRHHVGQNVI